MFSSRLRRFIEDFVLIIFFFVEKLLLLQTNICSGFFLFYFFGDFYERQVIKRKYFICCFQVGNLLKCDTSKFFWIFVLQLSIFLMTFLFVSLYLVWRDFSSVVSSFGLIFFIRFRVDLWG